MWVITGPFSTEDLGLEKSKLLKPSTTYTVGRKDADIIINSKKISHHQCDFIVGEHTVDHVDDHNIIPTLEILNTNAKDKTYSITRAEEATGVGQNEKKVLESGDAVALVTGIVIKVEWRPVCVFQPPSRGKSTVSTTILKGCASLGIKLSQKMHEGVTHHLAAHYIANLTMVTSLLNLSRIVKPEWLNEVLRLGSLSKNDENATGTSLEDNFVLPPETKFRPSFSPSLLPKQKTFDVWEPNEERVHFFKPFRFICMQEKSTEVDADIREAIDRGGGSYETFNVADGVEKLHRVLARSRAKEGKKTIVVGDIDSLQTAVGYSTWKKFVSEARSYATDILAPSKIVQSVIDVDVSLLEMSTEDSPPRSSPLPENVPNSIPEEPTMQPDVVESVKEARVSRADRLLAEVSERPRKRLARATPASPKRPESSEHPEPPPSEKKPLTRRRFGLSREPSVQPPSPPRKVLTRRTVVDDSDNDVGTSARKMKESTNRVGYAALLDIDPDDQAAKRRARMKRRMEAPATLEAESMTAGTTGIPPTQLEEKEPPLKKFRALFESTAKSAEEMAHFAKSLANPDLSVEAIVNGSQTQTETQMETQGAGRSGRVGRTMGASTMAILREEEEETQAETVPRDLRVGKRPRINSTDESVVGPGDGMEVEVRGARSRSRAVSNASTSATTAGPSAAKKRAIENVNAVQRATSSEPASGAVAKKPVSVTFDSREERIKAAEQAKEAEKGKDKQASSSKLDTDDAFLKAIASTKRGKKTEDDFDREFNKLKIRKPDLDKDRRDPEEEWALLKEFGDDSNVRGNFMVIVDLVPYKKDVAAIEAACQRNSNPAWDGLPNFKKFKQKAPSAPRPKIELVVSQDSEPTVDPSYWKTSKSQNRELYTQMDSQFDDIDSPKPTSKKATKSQFRFDSEDEEPELANGRRSRKPPSTAGSATSTSKKATSSRSKAAAKNTQNALFLDSDDDIQEVDESMAQSSRARSSLHPLDDSDFDEDQTLKSTSELKGKSKAPAGGSRRTTTRTAKGRAKPAPAILEEDSDDAVFKGFGR